MKKVASVLLFWTLAATMSLASGLAHSALNFSFNALDESSFPGDGIHLEWVVVNDGSGQENNVSVEVPMPGSGINFLYESTTEGGVCPGSTCDPNETIVWSLGNLPAGESRQGSFVFVVAGNAPNAGIPMEGRLHQGGGVLSTSNWTQSISSSQVAELAIDSSDAHVALGTPFSYGILAGNTGSSPLNGATLSVPVPAGLTINSAPGGSISGNTVTWSLGNFPAGRVTRRVINVTPTSTFGTGDLIVLNNATLTGSVFGVTQSVVADHVVTVGNPAIELQVRAQETQFAPGEAQNIEFVVSNTSSQVAQNTTVQLMYPAWQNFIYEAESGAQCPGSTCDAGEHMVWTIGNLLPGETQQMRFVTFAPTNATEGRPVRWHGSVRLGANVVRREYLATGVSTVDMNLQVDSDETKILPGDSYTYTFNLGNIGTGAIDNVVLSVPVPDEVSVLETYGGSVSSGVVTWQFNTMAAGALKHQYLKVQANTGLAYGTLINLIDAEASTTVFGIPQSTMSQHSMTVGDAPIDVELRVQQGAVRRGESFVMEIVASNTGSQVEQNVNATLLYPDNLSFKYESNLESAICGGSTCDPGERMVIPFGNLLPGETKSSVVTMTSLTNALLGEHTTWMGTVSAAGGLSRRFEATVGITEVATELQITTNELLVGAGSNVTYQIASGNTGGSILSQAVLTVPIPEGMSLVASPNGTLQDGRVVYALGNLDDEEIALRELTLAVPAGASNGAQFALENVELSGFVFGIEQMTYANHVVTVGSSPLTGQISVSPVDAKPGDPVQVTIDVENNSTQVEQDVQAFLRYPTGVSFRYETDMDGGVCAGSTCDSEEGVVWSLGNLLPAETRQINFSTTILTSEAEGGMIEWPGRVQAGVVKQRRIEFGSLVGDITGPPDPPVLCNGKLVNVNLSLGQTATSGDDVILGTNGADTIYAFGGNDTICALGGADIIYAGNGDDWVDAGPGRDEVIGSNGADTIYGNTGNDTLSGGPANDTIFGEEGNDVLFGNSGPDFLDGGIGVDEISGGSGDDVIYTGTGATVGTGIIVDGGAGDDTIIGFTDADEIRGSSDDDMIFGGGGNDRLFGGGGNDEIEGESGDDLIRGNAGNDVLRGGNGNDNINGFGSKDTIYGGVGDDVLAGSTGNDTIYGESGNDTILGGGGNDVLFGNSGLDLLEGGGGNDAMDGGGSAPDTCDGQGGIDTAAGNCEVVANVP